MHCLPQQPRQPVSAASSRIKRCRLLHAAPLRPALQLFALAAAATPLPGPGGAASLQLSLLLPDAGLLATPLYTKRLCHVPLAEALLKPGRMAAWQVRHSLQSAARMCMHARSATGAHHSVPARGTAASWR